MNHKNNKKYLLEILSLEDSPMDAELIYENLCANSEYEIKMDIVIKEEEFISAISLKKYDLILADFNLPNFNAFVALDHAKSLCPSTPFICVSGYIGEETAVDLLKQGATMVTCASDILEALKWEIIPAKQLEMNFSQFSDEEKWVLNSIEIEPKGVDSISIETGISLNNLLACLTSLELKGIIKQIDGEKYKVG